MTLEREIDILMQTKGYMDQIAGFGLDGEFDKKFKRDLVKLIEDLKHVGFIQLADKIDALLDTKDIKTYVRVEFILKALEEEIIKNIRL